MKKILVLFFLLFSLNVFSASFEMSDKELENLNHERTANGFSLVNKNEITDDMIQNDLDRRLDENLSLMREKKSIKPAMPLMEKIGKLNSEREELRKNAYRNAVEAMKMK